MLIELRPRGLTRLNVSINAISDKMAKMLEGHGKYDIAHVKKICEYAVKKLEVYLSPVFVPGYNEDELGEIVKFAKQIGAKVGIQNFLEYKGGRIPQNTKSMPFDEFFEILRKLEKELDFKLILDGSDFGVVNLTPLPKPFKKDQIVEAVIKAPGRNKGEILAAAMERCITIPGFEGDFDKFNNRKVRVKITSDKHNLFFGKVV